MGQANMKELYIKHEAKYLDNLGVLVTAYRIVWKVPEFDVFAGASHPQTHQIRGLSSHGWAVTRV